MATKLVVADGDERPIKRQGKASMPKIVDTVVGQWKEFTTFLGDVRSEMRKVVTPSWKEVKTTTAVVIIAVFIFGLFFFVVDTAFGSIMDKLFHKLGS
jgi:preprotein translocase subunit SecE